MSKFAFILLMVLSGSQVDALASIPDGAYTGWSRKSGDVRLLVRGLKGRDGSSLALLIWSRDTAGWIYVMDPVGAGTSYTLTPLRIRSDGEIETSPTGPSFVIGVSGTKDNPELSLSSEDDATSKLSSVQFSSRSRSPLEWTSFSPGTYENELWFHKERVTISDLDPENNQALAGFAEFSEFKNGNYQMREKAPNLFMLHRMAAKSTGFEVESTPSAIAVFVNGRLILASTSGAVLYILNK